MKDLKRSMVNKMTRKRPKKLIITTDSQTGLQAKPSYIFK